MGIETITLTFVDEGTETISGRTFKCTSDRLAFERHYGFSFASKIQIPDDAHLLVASEELAALSESERAYQVDLANRINRSMAGVLEEWTAFFVWRCWSRAHKGDARVPPFLEFAETLAAIEISETPTAKQEAAESPLALAAPAGS